MKGSKAFEGVIKAYLDRYATRDEVFAEKYQSNNKSIEECCSYIASEVRKMGVNGLDDAEVFGLAIHYYDEEDIKAEKVNYDVVCNHTIELTEEEKAEAKEKAIKQYQDKVIAELKEKNAKKNAKTVKFVPNQPSLFD